MLKLISTCLMLVFVISSAISDEGPDKNDRISINTELPGGDFVLASSQGRFSLQQLRGKLVLLYFGYTKCPDICPTSLATLTQALNELDEDELSLVQGVFVSVDPQRDTLQVLDSYVSYFHPNLTGVTGSESEVAAAAKRYGVEYEFVTQEDSSFGYTVNHSADIYLINADGELRYVFPHQTPSYVILEALRYLLGNQ